MKVRKEKLKTLLASLFVLSAVCYWIGIFIYSVLLYDIEGLSCLVKRFFLEKNE